MDRTLIHPATSSMSCASCARTQTVVPTLRMRCPSDDGSLHRDGSFRTRTGRRGAGGMSAPHPSASFSARMLRVELENRPGSVCTAGRCDRRGGRTARRIDLVRVDHGGKVRDVTVLAADERSHRPASSTPPRGVPMVSRSTTSRPQHSCSISRQLEVAAKSPLKTRDDLSMAYTPGVARTRGRSPTNPEKVWNLTIKQNAVAVVTDGIADSRLETSARRLRCR